MTIKIEDIFVEDHKFIEKAINDMDIEKLRQLVKNHFKEENILYHKYSYNTGEKIPIMQKILQEHKDILNKLEKDPEEAIRLLKRHKNIEERTLYPELDNKLSEWDKEEAYREIKAARK